MRQRPRSRAVALFTLLALTSSCVSTNLPPISSAGARFQPLADETALWEQSRAEEQKLLTKVRLYRDPALEAYLGNVVARLNPPGMAANPALQLQVHVVSDPTLNAFAYPHGSLYVHTGLLARVENEDQLATVLGHEMTHVANGDMVTLTLIQGIVNTFVLFLARVVGNIIDRAVFRSDDGRGIASILTFYVLQIVFGLLATPIVMWFSRQREFRADRGGAQLAGTGSMIAALEDLKRGHEPLPAQQFQAFGIADGGIRGGLARLFMSHPPLDERIAALRTLGTS